MKLASRCRSVAPSATLTMNARAQALQQSGVNVLSMSAGEPDFNTPQSICDGAVRAMQAGQTRYTPVTGTAKLRQAIAASCGALYDMQPSLKEIIVGTGGKQVLYNAIMTAVDEGDEVLFAAPYWVSYPDMVRLAGGVPVPVWGKESQGFLPTAADWAAHISSKTRLLIINSPSNPTGATYSAAELQQLAELLRQHADITIISDDIYSGLTFDAPFAGIAAIAPDLRPRLMIATGVSKSYAMTGWRIGFGIGPADWIGAMSDLQGACTSGACSIAQAAAEAALTGDQAEVSRMREVFRTRRDRIVLGLRAIEGLTVVAPKGAFYAFPNVKAFLTGTVTTAEALCEQLLNDQALALVPGGAFGAPGFVRLSFALSEADIDEGLRRLRQGLSALK